MSDNVVFTAFILIFVALGIGSCVSIIGQSQACRERGGEPIVDRFYQVACVKRASP